MATIDDFVNHTQQFMADNIVLPPARASQSDSIHQQSGVYTMRLIKSARQGTKVSNGSVCDIYRLEKPDAWNGANAEGDFVGYFCYYETDEVHLLVVDKDADLMFTPTMNGCSFGVGAANAKGARMVGHANVSRVDSTAHGFNGQVNTQNAQLTSAMPHGTIMDSHAYTPFGTGQSGTTFGIRNSGTGTWGFFTQVWKREGTTYQHYGVNQFV